VSNKGNEKNAACGLPPISANRLIAMMLVWLFVSGWCGDSTQVLATESVQKQGSASQPAGDPGGQAATGMVKKTSNGDGSQTAGTMYIQEYRVLGAHQLNALEIGEVVYPFLGPGRSKEDVEHAREALEKAYQVKGFQTVSVQIPLQQVKGGVVVLQVVEGTVGRLRVNGARYFSPDQIKAQAPALAEGKVVDFNQVTKDIVALNQLPDRTVTPVLRAGLAPGTVDIDLNVKDTLPVHGSLELNNRYSPDTTDLRLNGSVSYNNLWQLGHSAGFSFQLAPERLEDAEVFSAYYLARFPDVNWLSLMVQGTKQNSDVSTLSSSDATGRGEVVGARAIINLPPLKDFFHSVSIGIDFKHFVNGLTLGGATTVTPVTYFPLSAQYSATWRGKGYETDLNAGANLTFRGTGSNLTELDNSRFKADGGYIYVRGDLSHTHDLPGNFQIYGKMQGQVANEPLLSSEQIAGGGLSTVRGYLESEELGDNGIFGSVELRSPPLQDWLHNKVDDWRIYAFADCGMLDVIEALPQQQDHFNLASYGVGTRLRILDHLNGSLDVGVPLIGATETKAHDLLLTFRVWADF